MLRSKRSIFAAMLSCTRTTWQDLLLARTWRAAAKTWPAFSCCFPGTRCVRRFMAISGNREWGAVLSRGPWGLMKATSASTAASPRRSENAGDSRVGVRGATRRGACAGSQSCWLRSLGTGASSDGTWGMIVVGGKAFGGACVLFLLGSLQGLREHVAEIWREPAPDYIETMRRVETIAPRTRRLARINQAFWRPLVDQLRTSWLPAIGINLLLTKKRLLRS